MCVVDTNEPYAIGDAARRIGLSANAVRQYADTGVVTPAAVTSCSPSVLFGVLGASTRSSASSTRPGSTRYSTWLQGGS